MYICIEKWGFHKWGYPHSWLVHNGKSQSKMDDLGVPPILGNPRKLENTLKLYHRMDGCENPAPGRTQ